MGSVTYYTCKRCRRQLGVRPLLGYKLAPPQVACKCGAVVDLSIMQNEWTALTIGQKILTIVEASFYASFLGFIPAMIAMERSEKLTDSRALQIAAAILAGIPGIAIIAIYMWRKIQQSKQRTLNI